MAMFFCTMLVFMLINVLFFSSKMENTCFFGTLLCILSVGENCGWLWRIWLNNCEFRSESNKETIHVYIEATWSVCKSQSQFSWKILMMIRHHFWIIIAFMFFSSRLRFYQNDFDLNIFLEHVGSTPIIDIHVFILDVLVRWRMLDRDTNKKKINIEL